MLTVVAFGLVVGFFGSGPFFVGAQATCSGDNNNNSRSERSISKCDLEQVQEMMREKKLPKELKVEVEGKLYSVPEAVEMITPTRPKTRENWWKRVARKARALSRSAAADAGNSIDDDVDNNGDGDDDNANANENDDSNDDHRNAKNNNVNDLSDNGFDDVAEARDSELAKNETMSNRSIDRSDASEAKTEAAVAVEKDVRPAGEHSCQICFDHDHSTVMLPCGHGGLCWDCGLQIYALTEECPMCRSKIELLVPLNGNKRRCEGENQFVSSADYGKDGKPLAAFHHRVVP